MRSFPHLQWQMGSRTDPLQAKAESISNSSTYGTTYLRRGLEGSTARGTTAAEKGAKICKSNNSADTKVK